MADLAEFLQRRNALAGPEQEERGFLLPYSRDPRTNTLSPAFPGILHQPYQAMSRLLSQSGQYRPGSGDEQPVRDAANVAGMVGLGGLGMAAPAGSLAANAARRAKPPSMSHDTARGYWDYYNQAKAAAAQGDKHAVKAMREMERVDGGRSLVDSIQDAMKYYETQMLEKAPKPDKLNAVTGIGPVYGNSDY